MYSRFIRLSVVCTLLCLAPDLLAQTSWNRIGPDLEAAIRSGEQGPFPVFILLADRVDVIGMGAAFEAERLPQPQRTATLIPALKQRAAATQSGILLLIDQQPDVVRGSVSPFWITNTIYLETGIPTIDLLDSLPDIELIELAPEPETAEASVMAFSLQQINGPGGHEPSLDVIQAPKLWALGYTGNSRKALIIDTGTDPTHPALSRSFVGNYAATSTGWYGLTEDPYDCDNHGTHVAGTILGMDRDTKDTIGVAPNGLWMASPAIECTNGPGATQALQWAIDPDGDPTTTSDMPDAINNSWRFLPNGWGCSSPVQQAINALEAAGVAVISAAGNDHPDYTVGGPAYANYSLVNSFAVGAVNPNSASLAIAGFSSRGPSECGGSGALAIKPEVVAPGVGIRSAVRGGGYAVYQGTSMASPHVAGAILLLKEAFPSASGTELKMALYQTAIDLGDPGEDNTYGNGLIDVEAAYYYLIAEGLSPAPVSRDHDAGISIVDNHPCGLDHEPTIYLTNNGLQPLITVTILRSYSDGYSDTLGWSGIVLPGEEEEVIFVSHTLPQSGRFSMEIDVLTVNGVEDPYFIDNWDTTTFTALAPLTVLQKQLNVCIGGAGMLEATIQEADSQAVIKWYDQESGGNVLGSGPELPTGLLTSSQIYYMAPGRGFRLGPEPSQAAGGFFDGGISGGVPFRVMYPCTIDKVTLLANSPGERVIQIRNEQGTPLYSKVVEVPAGKTTVELGFQMEPGGEYRMALGFAESGLWVQTMAPQEIGIPGVLSLTGTANGQIAYFFDWQVSYELPCPRTPAFVTVSAGQFSPDFDITAQDGKMLSLTGKPSNAKRYRWFLGDGTVKEGASVSHTYAEGGRYPVGVLVTSAANCSRYAERLVDINLSTSLGSASWSQALSLYPNPARTYCLSPGEEAAKFWLGCLTSPAGTFNLSSLFLNDNLIIICRLKGFRKEYSGSVR